MIYNNGDKYEGEWKNDLKHGNGIMNYKNGEKFYFSKDKFEEIEKYDGYWEKNKKNGKGIIYFKNGDKLESNFNKDTFR